MKYFYLIVLLIFISCHLSADDWNEFKVKRETEYKFVSEPKITKSGDDQYVIEFETSAFCDVTVVLIESSTKKIIRHLASGVLGKNAPVPFKKNSKKQKLLWDSKDDHGRYIGDQGNVSLRVSLGLKPEYDRDLYTSPEKRVGKSSLRYAATKDGVYIYDGDGTGDFVKLFDHDGKYIQTAYPLSAQQMSVTKGLKMFDYPNKKGKFPFKQNFMQNTFFIGGTNSTIKGGVSVVQGTAHYGMHGKGATFLTANDKIMVAGMGRAHFIGLNGNKTAPSFYGPAVGEKTTIGRKRLKTSIPPLAAAISPDGKKVYFTGFQFGVFRKTATEGLTYNGAWNTVHAVKVLDVASGKISLFKGHEKLNKFGADNNSFNVPINVSVDHEGRVYVADHLNHRVQIFDASGKFLKSIKVQYPSYVTLLPKSKQIAVGSFGIETIRPKDAIGKYYTLDTTVTLFKSVSNPVKVGTYPLPKEYATKPFGYLYNGDGIKASMTITDYSGEVRVWVCKETAGITKLNFSKISSANTVILTLKNKKFEVLKEFQKKTKKDLISSKNIAYGRWRMNVNPKTGKLYLPITMYGFVGKSFKQLVEIDPKTNQQKIVDLPFDAEDMTFDSEGFLYLKSTTALARFEMKSLKEVPFDYGSELKVHTSSSSDRKVGNIISGIVLPFSSGWHHGGMFVTLKGNIVTSGPYYFGAEQIKQNTALVKNYSGRVGHSKMTHLVHVYNKHGQIHKIDLLRGLPDVYGLGMDERDNLYVMSAATRVLEGKRYHNIKSGTIMKLPNTGAKAITTSKKIPLPLDNSKKPKGKPDLMQGGTGFWVKDAEWFYGAVGFSGKNPGVGCACHNARMTLDYLARTFAPEVERYQIAVLDSAGNLICNIGRYGNVDSKGPKSIGKLGGDEVGLMHGAYVATDTDKKLFIGDPGNYRIVSVNLNYHVNKIVPIPVSSKRAKNKE